MDAHTVPGIELAIEAAGSGAELARRIGVTQQAVAAWAAEKTIPPRRVLDVERATGVPRRVLAPELFDACQNCGA